MELIPLLTLGNSTVHIFSQRRWLASDHNRTALLQHPPAFVAEVQSNIFEECTYWKYFWKSLWQLVFCFNKRITFLRTRLTSSICRFFLCPVLLLAKLTWNAKYLRFTIPRDRLVALFLLLKQYSGNLRKTSYMKIWRWNQIFCTCLS
jgi:hypothetical protein